MEWFFIGLIGLAIWGYATRPSSRSSLDKKQSFENQNRDHLSREYGANRHSGTVRSLDDLGIRITTSSQRQTKSKIKNPLDGFNLATAFQFKVKRYREGLSTLVEF